MPEVACAAIEGRRAKNRSESCWLRSKAALEKHTKIVCPRSQLAICACQVFLTRKFSSMHLAGELFFHRVSLESFSDRFPDQNIARHHPLELWQG